MVNIFYYQTDIGRVGIAAKDNQITNLYFAAEVFSLSQVRLEETALLKEASKQLQEYLCGERRVFDLPLAPVGTEFMLRVWQTLCAIPYGRTCSYKDIAQCLGRPKAARAVGLANHKNPLPIFIPCHRVVGVNGKLVGYLGGLDVKTKLLALEQRYGVL
ncbi:methylated-DNA--protein-cysteine methyltransferase [Sporomusaceae bacterium FL31]|nr:methylated-DNA--protein-cysteine methyltransferase [Sporomusaceae bacterium FL31]GCE34913.1 methylated-DNA--protein-cysteine methyltransferase [Sporomusaceae bacterium]